jgi:hypothetical protein
MPKEHINYPLAIEDPETHKMHPPGPEFSIHWNGGPQGYAQLSVEFDARQIEEYLLDLRKHSPVDSRAFIYSEPLDRESMQRLIRHGRRARDLVHGADE